ncbi:hypothetical protein [Nostoc sp.]
MLDQAGEYLNRLIVRLLRFLGVSSRKKYQLPSIKSEYTSAFCRLISLENNTVNSVAVWRAILRYTSDDLLLTCDRLQRSPTTIRQTAGGVQKQMLPPRNFIFTEHPFATHQIAISRISRYYINNKIKIECLGMWHLDLVGVSGIAWSAGDRFAMAVTKLCALDLLENHVDDLNWTERIDFHAREIIGSNHNAIGKLI